jgi:VanZ family protein
MLLFAALFWTCLIVFLCLIKSSDLPTVAIPNLDKVIHAFLHFVFTSLWFFFLKKQLKSLSMTSLLAFSFIASVFFGIAIEFMQQYFTTTRSADVFDVLANMTGALTAAVLIYTLNKTTGIIDKI